MSSNVNMSTRAGGRKVPIAPKKDDLIYSNSKTKVLGDLGGKLPAQQHQSKRSRGSDSSKQSHGS